MGQQGSEHAVYAYARVLVDMVEKGSATIPEEVGVLSEVFGAEDVNAFFANPGISLESKVTLLEHVGGVCGFSNALIRFACVVISEGLFLVIGDIFDKFVIMLRKRRGMYNLEVISAVPLTQREERNILDTLIAQYGTPELVTKRVDPGILGGYIAKGDSFVVDASYEGRLRELHRIGREAILNI